MKTVQETRKALEDLRLSKIRFQKRYKKIVCNIIKECPHKFETVGRDISLGDRGWEQCTICKCSEYFIKKVNNNQEWYLREFTSD